MVDVFKALSDETRLRILALVWDDELCVCEIEGCVQLTQSNASRHLAVLKRAGILLSTKRAQWAYYKKNEAFCGENPELCDYLTRQWNALPTYCADKERLGTCKAQNLCGRID